MAKTKLSMNRARKIGDSYVAFCSPEQLYSLQNGTAWIESRNYADTQKLLTGEVGQYMGVKFIETDIVGQYPTVHIIAAGTGTHFTGLMVGAEALGEGWDQELKITFYNDDPLVADAGATKRLQWNARGGMCRLKDDNVVTLWTSRDKVFGG
jgi:N4-gp56 family major capsid protein